MRAILVSSRSFGQVVPDGVQALTGAGFDVRRVPDSERPLDAGRLARLVAREQPVALIVGAEPISSQVLRVTPELKVVQKHGVGVDNIDIPAATAAGVVVANAPGTNTEAVADLALGLILTLLRQIVPAIESTRAGRWDRYVGRELGQATVGVVGTGRVGKAVIRRLTGFGSPVVAYDVIQDCELAASPGVRYVGLAELLETSDVVTLHIPLTEETRMLIGPAELARMRKTAFLVNTARGELLDELALAASLAAGEIAGAATDVFAAEPPQASPLLKAPNLLATPHIAAYTREAMVAMDLACAETVVTLVSGRWSDRVVNPDVFGIRST